MAHKGWAWIVGAGLAFAFGSPASATETITYTYDAQGQVVGVDRAGSVNNGDTVDISYDKAGNRTNYLSADSTTPIFWIDNVSATEGSSLSFTVHRDNYTTGVASVNYASASGTATSGTDFTAVSGTLNFTSGQTSKPVTVTTAGDTTAEADETMKVTLSSPSAGGLISNAVGTGTIIDNDPIALTDNSLAVLTAHQSTYSCFVDNTYAVYGVVFGACSLVSTGQNVYAFYTAPGTSNVSFATGYSRPVGPLLVLSAYYGTSNLP